MTTTKFPTPILVPHAIGLRAAVAGLILASCTTSPSTGSGDPTTEAGGGTGAGTDTGDPTGGPGDTTEAGDTSSTADGGGSTGSTPASELHDDIAAVVPEGANGGVVALVVRDGIVAQAAVGTANVDGDPLAADTTFNIASVTKLYTATLIFQLEDQGLLDTAAPLSMYLPGTEYGDDVTLDTLLSHRSGIPDYAANPQYLLDALGDPQRIFTTEELIEYSTFEAPGPAGEAYAYSNTGYSLLGLVVEAVSGLPFAEALEAGIVEPLGLSSTTVIDPPDFPADLPSAWLDPAGFGLPPDTVLPVMPVPAALSGCQADCGVITTAPELRMVLEALFDGALVSEQALAAMTTTEPDAPDDGRGLTIFDTGPGGPAYGHGGGGTGYSSIVAYQPTSGDITIFFASNDGFDLDPLYADYGL